jgi:hypothetical protein
MSTEGSKLFQLMNQLRDNADDKHDSKFSAAALRGAKALVPVVKLLREHAPHLLVFPDDTPLSDGLWADTIMELVPGAEWPFSPADDAERMARIKILARQQIWVLPHIGPTTLGELLERVDNEKIPYNLTRKSLQKAHKKLKAILTQRYCSDQVPSPDAYPSAHGWIQLVSQMEYKRAASDMGNCLWWHHWCQGESGRDPNFPKYEIIYYHPGLKIMAAYDWRRDLWTEIEGAKGIVEQEFSPAQRRAMDQMRANVLIMQNEGLFAAMRRKYPLKTAETNPDLLGARLFASARISDWRTRRDYAAAINKLRRLGFDVTDAGSRGAGINLPGDASDVDLAISAPNIEEATVLLAQAGIPLYKKLPTRHIHRFQQGQLEVDVQVRPPYEFEKIKEVVGAVRGLPVSRRMDILSEKDRAKRGKIPGVTYKQIKHSYYMDAGMPRDWSEWAIRAGHKTKENPTKDPRMAPLPEPFQGDDVYDPREEAIRAVARGVGNGWGISIGRYVKNHAPDEIIRDTSSPTSSFGSGRNTRSCWAGVGATALIVSRRSPLRRGCASLSGLCRLGSVCQ